MRGVPRSNYPVPFKRLRLVAVDFFIVLECQTRRAQEKRKDSDDDDVYGVVVVDKMNRIRRSIGQRMPDGR